MLDAEQSAPQVVGRQQHVVHRLAQFAGRACVPRGDQGRQRHLAFQAQVIAGDGEVNINSVYITLNGEVVLDVDDPRKAQEIVMSLGFFNTPH